MPPRSSLISILARGAAAGAAGTTALNAVTYLDMALRARPASDTPERTIERIAERIGVQVPGRGSARSNRLSGLGALGGLATGTSMGVCLAGMRAIGLRGGALVTAAIAATTALVGANGPMVALKITDPRSWSATDWASDVVPHLAYGLATGWLLTELDPG
jgi:hypothetical protein